VLCHHLGIFLDYSSEQSGGRRVFDLVNFSLELIYKRFRRLFGTEKADGIRYYNTYFISRLKNLSSTGLKNPVYAYANIATWSTGFKFFEAEKIFIPINHENSH
jgi:Ulp1 family protease